jgi:hypothetical protein
VQPATLDHTNITALREMRGFGERNHFLRYRLTRDNLGELREEEKELLVSRLIEHYSPIKKGFNGRWSLARMKHEKEFLLISLIDSAFDNEKGGDPND